MFLKKLIVEGFKSIGIRKEIDFLNAINIIMGVNGSGKSNVFECIEWVLGGKSAKQLRASNMEDVIFDGGQSSGRANFAEATLVFDNTNRDFDIDTDEIYITRKLTRGKGNEYFINYESAKLKDIKKLFENKGIGKNNYAITGQSKITDFIMMNGEETRHVIEEAAGISGFRLKKEEILASIVNYDRDIERIDAVIFEMEQRLKPLRKQIKNAEIYKSAKLELDQKKLFAYSKKLEECTIKINDIYGKKDELLSKKDELFKVKEEIELFLNNYTNVYDLKMEDIANLEKNKGELEEQISEANKNTLMYENHKNNLIEKKENMTSNLEKLEKSTSGEGLEASDLFKSINELDKEISSLNDDIKLLTEIISDEDSLLKSKNKELEEITSQINELETSIKVRESKFETEKESIPNLKEESNALLLSINEIKGEINSITESISNNSKLLELANSNIKELQKVDKELKVLENILNSSKRGNNRKNKILEIRELIKDVPGFNDVTFNLISFDDEYAQAFDSLFGGTLFNFVVDNTASANKCIDILKKNKIPPEKFVVLDKISSRNKSVVEIEKAENTYNLLTYDKKYNLFVEEYFMNSFVSKNDEDAEFAWNKCSQKYRVCTIEGTLYSANIIKGGFIQKNIKQAQKEYDLLNNKKAELLKLNNETFSNIYELKSKISVIESSVNSMQNTYNSLNDRLSKEENKINRVNETISKYTYSVDNYNSDIEELNSKKDSLILQVEEFTKEKESLESSLNNNKTLKEEKTLKINSSKTLLEEHEKNYYIFKNNSKEKIESLKADIVIVEGQLEETIDSYNESLKTQTSLEDSLNTVNEKISNIRQEIEDMIKDKDIKTSALTKSIEDISSIDGDVIKLDFEIEKITEKEDKYRISLSDIPDEIEYVTFEDSITNILKDISALEKKIKSLGFINTDALDEYEELNERYTSLTTNKKDLEDSKNKLLVVVQELQDKMLSKYVECFNVIQKDFSEIFKRLFAGGAGELIMDNPDSPLDSGVTIKATPPGKKNKPLSLLSGGEKSLAAVSFIFALLKYSPSPVVIFDEIDAALDEINVSLIADYISENKNVQYIIVSHRKPMMKAADVIYTAMMTGGITNLISTKLDNKTA